jgi:hypothetical protein
VAVKPSKSFNILQRNRLKKTTLSVSEPLFSQKYNFYTKNYALMELLENAKILADANVLINDFFFRHPEFGTARVVPERQAQVEAYRQRVHLALENLSQRTDIQIFTPSFVLLRVASLLSDLFVPNALARQELIYLSNNYGLIELNRSEIEKIVWQIQTTDEENLLGMEDYFLLAACKQTECTHILTSVRKSYDAIEGVKVLYPEQIK